MTEIIEPNMYSNIKDIPISIFDTSRFSSMQTFLAFIKNYYNNNSDVIDTIVYGDTQYYIKLKNTFNIINDLYMNNL